MKAGYTLLAKNELISNRTHRHELPVVDLLLRIIENNSEFVVIDKPSSIPVHPCGRYRHNSIIYILAKEYGLNHLRSKWEHLTASSYSAFFLRAADGSSVQTSILTAQSC